MKLRFLKVQNNIFYKFSKSPNENGDGTGPDDIALMSFWPKLSQAGVECAQSRLSSIRKLGCGLIAALAAETKSEEGFFYF